MRVSLLLFLFVCILVLPQAKRFSTPTTFVSVAESPTIAGSPSTPTPTNSSGAYVATLGRMSGPETDFFFGMPGAPSWVTSRNHSSLDFSAALDIAPGQGNSWALSLEYATLSSAQSCEDITNWTSVPLCTLSGSVKSCTVSNKPVNIIGPACFHGRATFTGTTRNLGGGTASFYFNDGPVHFQGSGQTSVATGVFFGGNVARSPNQDRAYWISPGVAFKSASGVVTVPTAPGTGKAWNIKIASSTTALTPGQNCAALSYVKTANVCTISGPSQKQCNWSPVTVNVPSGGCVQLEATCTGGTCATGSVSPYYGLDLSTSDTFPHNATEITYETAGSGAFDLLHSFGIGPWAISDRQPVNGIPTLGQQYWLAPATGLNACSGAFTFEQPTAGTGQYEIGLRFSTTTPTTGQGCLDLAYTDSAALCSMRPGEKSCTFPLTAVAIPAGGCFALNVKTSGGSPTNAGQFNWQANCTKAGPAPTPTPTPTPPTPTPTPTPAPTPQPPQLLLDLSGPEPNQIAALDSVLFLRDPFPVISVGNLFSLGLDQNTRLTIFVANLQLAPGETSSSVLVNLIDSNNQSYEIAAEDVRQVPNFNFVQVRFRLPDNLSLGTGTIRVIAHGEVSNSGTIRIRI